MNGDKLFKVLMWAVGLLAGLLLGVLAYDAKKIIDDLGTVKVDVQQNKETLIGIEKDIESLEKSLIQSHRGGIPILKSLPIVGGAFKDRLDIEDKPKREKKKGGKGSWEEY